MKPPLRRAGYCFSAVTQRVITLAWNVGHLLITLSSSPQPQRRAADKSAPVEGVPITNGRGGKPAAGKAAKPQQRKGPPSAHEVVVAEALGLALDEKQNNTQYAAADCKSQWNRTAS